MVPILRQRVWVPPPTTTTGGPWLDRDIGRDGSGGGERRKQCAELQQHRCGHQEAIITEWTGTTTTTVTSQYHISFCCDCGAMRDRRGRAEWDNDVCVQAPLYRLVPVYTGIPNPVPSSKILFKQQWETYGSSRYNIMSLSKITYSKRSRKLDCHGGMMQLACTLYTSWLKHMIESDTPAHIHQFILPVAAPNEAFHCCYLFLLG